MDASLRQRLIATWGVFCVVALLGQAIWRLTPLALEPWLDGSMSPFQIALYIGFALFNAYAEGYRGFQLRFSPRVVARAYHLGAHPNLRDVVLALPFCMSLYHSTKRQLIVSWVLIVVITAVVIAVKMLPQPWRGIIDGGVVIGLGWGVLSLIYFWARGLKGPRPPASDLPPAPV